jgi:hypothetical protein
MFALASMFFPPLVGVGSGQNTTLISLDRAIGLALAHNHSIKATRTLIFQNPAQDSHNISEYAYRRGAATCWIFSTLSAVTDPFSWPIARHWLLI